VAHDDVAMAIGYADETALPWPLLVDERRELYRAYQMGQGKRWAIYGPASIWHYIKLLLRGRRLRPPGPDWLQLGGDVLVDPGGVVRLYFVSKSPHDRPTCESLLSVIRG